MKQSLQNSINIKAKNLIFLLVGICIDQFGVALCTNSGFGISAVSFVPFSLNQAFPALTFGTWSFLFQVTQILALMAITKSMHIQYLLAFGVSLISGKVLDLMRIVTSSFPSSFLLRCIWCGFGIFCIALGVCLTIESNLPIQPKDMFARELSKIKGWRYKIIKTIFDVCCVSFSCTILLIFTGKLYGIGVGTLISALVMGATITAIRDALVKLHIIDKSVIK